MVCVGSKTNKKEISTIPTLQHWPWINWWKIWLNRQLTLQTKLLLMMDMITKFLMITNHENTGEHAMHVESLDYDIQSHDWFQWKPYICFSREMWNGIERMVSTNVISNRTTIIMEDMLILNELVIVINESLEIMIATRLLLYRNWIFIIRIVKLEVKQFVLKIKELLNIITLWWNNVRRRS